MMVLRLFSDEAFGLRFIQHKGSLEECKDYATTFLYRHWGLITPNAKLQWREDVYGSTLGYVEDENLPFKEEIIFIIKPMAEHYVNEEPENPKFPWLRLFGTSRELKTLRDCILYNSDPYGDVGHNLKVMIGVLVSFVINERYDKKAHGELMQEIERRLARLS